MIVAELRRWESGELGSAFKWSVLESQFGFTRQALCQKPAIKEAYIRVKQALRGGLVKSRADSITEIAELTTEVERLTAYVSEMTRRETLWKARWQRIAFHIRQAGVQAYKVDKPASGNLPDEREIDKILAPFDVEIPHSGRR